jgi:hypothetical protein
LGVAPRVLAQAAAPTLEARVRRALVAKREFAALAGIGRELAARQPPALPMTDWGPGDRPTRGT